MGPIGPLTAGVGCMIKLILSLMLAAAVSGCSLFTAAKVPATTISFNPKTDALHIVSPKDVTIGGVSVVKTANSFSISLTNYASTNNPALVGVVVSAQAAIASNAAVTINNLAGLAAQAASKVP
jgi:hypothetical protein